MRCHSGPGYMSQLQEELSSAPPPEVSNDIWREIVIRLHTLEDVARAACINRALRDACQEAELFWRWLPVKLRR